MPNALVLHNADVRTLDQSRPHVGSLLVRDGRIAAVGSDAPVTSPDAVASIRAAMTRRARSGEHVMGGTLSLDEALWLHIRNAAIAGRQDGERGRLAPGLGADLVRLPRQVLESNEARLAGARLQTMKAGTWVGGLIE